MFQTQYIKTYFYKNQAIQEYKVFIKEREYDPIYGEDLEVTVINKSFEVRYDQTGAVFHTLKEAKNHIKLIKESL